MKRPRTGTQPKPLIYEEQDYIATDSSVAAVETKLRDKLF